MEARIGSGSEALERALGELHRTIIASGARVLVIVEGADAAGKTTSIERAVRHLDPEHCRVVRLGPPSERERGEWYFQRYLAHLPTAGEVVFFDRSWYNRAAFEPVHGLCTAVERDAFLTAVPELERLLVADGLHLRKLFLAVGREAQARRLAERAETSRFDRAATATWSQMRAAQDHMIATTPPWIVVDTDDDRHGKLAALEAFVTALEVPDVRRSRHADDDSDERRSATR